MITFLPDSSFTRTTEMLSDRDLQRQVAHVKLILLVMQNRINGRLRNHPSVRMWRNYELALCELGKISTCEQKNRGGAGPAHTFFVGTEQLFSQKQDVLRADPPWLGRDDVHVSHRANLLRLQPEFYSQYGWSESPSDKYVWPKESHPRALILQS